MQEVLGGHKMKTKMQTKMKPNSIQGKILVKSDFTLQNTCKDQSFVLSRNSDIN